MLTVQSDRTPTLPLDTVYVTGHAQGTLRVLDGAGRPYAELAAAPKVALRVSGALGRHCVLALDPEGHLVDQTSFPVDCRTELDDGGEWRDLFEHLRWNIFKGRESKIVRYRGRPWFLFSDWIRDHVHILKGKKYFVAELKDAIELFGSTQQDDGMLYDFLMPHNPEATGTADRFHDRRFIEIVDEGRHFFQRVPVEADVEYLFVEGVYFTWKATGDTKWMLQWLPCAERALRYDLESPLRWSDTFQLIKRGYTADSWDVQGHPETLTTDPMDAVPGTTEFGIMHGDNTGFAASCRYLAELLDVAGRPEDANEWRTRAEEILARLNDVAWQDGYYRHFVPEREDLRLEPGDLEERQVSLSNALATNRGIQRSRARAILRTYQRIRDNRPQSAPAEFYFIYPPFERGFRGNLLQWHYMNGGVFPFIGGELARGAFRNGMDTYGVDVLRRLHALLDGHDGQFPYFWLGAIEPEPDRSFDVVDIRPHCNTDFHGDSVTGVVAWTGQGPGNDLACMPTGRRTYHRIPFDVIDPGENAHRACIGLAAGAPYVQNITVDVGRQAGCLYVLHTTAGSGEPVGTVTFHYADGMRHREYVHYDRHVKNWWEPTDVPYSRVEGWVCRVAWAGQNARTRVGVYTWGLNNPNPDKTIDTVTFTHSGLGHTWFILGLTLSDAPRYFEPADACYAWLENWNSAAVVAAVIEGLAGINDEGVAFDRIRLCPRWASAGVDDVTACAKYEASGGYVRYRYVRDSRGAMRIDLAGTSHARRLEIPLPEGALPATVTLDNETVEFELQETEDGHCVCLDTSGLGVETVAVSMQSERHQCQPSRIKKADVDGFE